MVQLGKMWLRRPCPAAECAPHRERTYRKSWYCCGPRRFDKSA